MSETKVKLPDLTPSEYSLLIQAMRFFHDNEKAVATDHSVDVKLRNKARGNAASAMYLLEKIG